MKKWLDQLSEGQERMLLSLLAALAFGALMFFSIRSSFPENLPGAIGAALFSAALIFAVSFTVLGLSARKLKKRQEEQEREEEKNGKEN